MQSRDSGLGRSPENMAQAKPKRGRSSIGSGVPNASKKKKPNPRNSFDELNNELKKLLKKKQFCDFNVINKNTINFDINPNQKVSANFNIWNAKELIIRVIFSDHEEIVEIVIASFEKFATKVKVELLRNAVAYIKRIDGRKEELFPKCFNWDKFMKCKYYQNLRKVINSTLNFMYDLLINSQLQVNLLKIVWVN